MPRTMLVSDARTGKSEYRAFTPEEEAEADAWAVVITERAPPRDLAAELDALKAVLSKKDPMFENDLAAELAGKVKTMNEALFSTATTTA